MDDLRRRVLDVVDIGPRPGDMEWSYWPVPGGGCFSAYHLRIIADELDRRNKLDCDVSDSVKNAQRDGVCRLCGEEGAPRRTPDGYIDEFVLDYGREFAHRTCIEREKQTIASEVSGEYDARVWAWAVIDNEQFISEPGTDPTHVFRNYCDVQTFAASRQLDRLVIVKLGPVAFELKARVPEESSGNEEKKPMKMPSREWFERMVSVDDSEVSVGGLASRVAELESSVPIAAEPWREVMQRLVDAAEGVRDWAGSPLIRVQDRYFKERDKLNAALVSAEELLSAPVTAPAASGTAVAEPVAWGMFDALLARSTPPQPALGWLKAEERKWIEYMESNCVLPYAGMKCMEAILNRDTPPEVVAACDMTPEPGDGELMHSYIEGWNNAGKLWRASIAAEGIKVKEVGK